MSNRTLEREPSKPEFDCGLSRYKVHSVANTCEALGDIKQFNDERTNWAGAILRIPDVWRLTQGDGVKVAVLDTGVDPDHPDLISAIEDTVDFTGDGIEDASGHGTHCAGIVGARLNGVGFVGVAPKSTLMIAKVLANNGRGSNAWVANGVYWAVESGADVISMSLGGPQSSQALFKAIQYALFHGVYVICAAGNEGALNSNSIGYPGRYGGVITVASHDQNGNPSGFSSQGGEVDVMAPGSEIWSTYKEGGYASLSGTSMATPFVSGLAALIASKHKTSTANDTPLQNNEDMKNHLLRMATHPGYHDNQSGYGPLIPFGYFYS
ncbi:S8 family peptidase [Enterovibrio sp. ZSDZ35]|uniref:S8 family peptidase n=1 Tax=Enterovibrio qingdaonensis TaxID=2899818 RepID=A0ABT5QSB2_9GAMM|nr:S8 family peptidase [Enterovibrio sp. ZSDZ35]MDD1783166.1 S8 family peptidase [Enterovibrio sp. ZSDZ35]